MSIKQVIRISRSTYLHKCVFNTNQPNIIQISLRYLWYNSSCYVCLKIGHLLKQITGWRRIFCFRQSVLATIYLSTGTALLFSWYWVMMCTYFIQNHLICTMKKYNTNKCSKQLKIFPEVSNRSKNIFYYRSKLSWNYTISLYTQHSWCIHICIYVDMYLYTYVHIQMYVYV